MVKTPLGKLVPTVMEFHRLPRSVIDGYRALEDLTGTTSDALDELGLERVVPASVRLPAFPDVPTAEEAVLPARWCAPTRRATPKSSRTSD